MTFIRKNKMVLVFYVMILMFSFTLTLRVDNASDNDFYTDAENTDIVLINPK